MIHTTIGSRIEHARNEQGFTHRQLAARLGVKTSTIENWELDRSEPRSNKLLTLSGVLNVPVLWLLEGEGQTGRPGRYQDFSETAAIQQKLERATALQNELAALLIDATADIARLQRQLDAESDIAA